MFFDPRQDDLSGIYVTLLESYHCVQTPTTHMNNITGKINSNIKFNYGVEKHKEHTQRQMYMDGTIANTKRY